MQLENIGKWKVFSLESGLFKLDGGAMMGSVPKVLWEKTNKPDSLNRISLALRCMLVDDGKNIILIETGIGHKNSDKFIRMFDINHENYTLSKALSEHGYSNENITHVILTHLHFDHSGGALEYDKNKELVTSFPNAQYYVSKNNWNAGKRPSPRDSASYLNENYDLLLDNEKLVLLDDNVTILDGISTYSVNGHTVGQQLIRVSDENKSIVFCSDLIPLASHIRLPWIMGYDLNASLTLEEKRIFLDKASKENWLLFFYHDPDVVAIRIEKDNKYYKIKDEYRRK